MYKFTELVLNAFSFSQLASCWLWCCCCCNRSVCFFGSQKAEQIITANRILNGSCEIKMQDLKVTLQAFSFTLFETKVCLSFTFIWWFFYNVHCAQINTYTRAHTKCMLFYLFKVLFYFPIQLCTLRHNSMVSLFVLVSLSEKF